MNWVLFVNVLVIFIGAVAYHELAHLLAARYYDTYESIVAFRRRGWMGLFYHGVAVGTSEFDYDRDRYVTSLVPFLYVVPAVLVWNVMPAAGMMFGVAGLATFSDVFALLTDNQDVEKFKVYYIWPRGVEA